MNLWIRSQDKIKLIKVEYVYVQHYEDYDYIDSNVATLGKYGKGNRALEILDEIQDELLSSSFIPNEQNETLICGSARVYEMPPE